MGNWTHASCVTWGWYIPRNYRELSCIKPLKRLFLTTFFDEKDKRKISKYQRIKSSPWFLNSESKIIFVCVIMRLCMLICMFPLCVYPIVRVPYVNWISLPEKQTHNISKDAKLYVKFSILKGTVFQLKTFFKESNLKLY